MTAPWHRSNNDNYIPILDGIRCFYSKTDTCNYMPTFKIVMEDPVDQTFLQTAAEIAMARYQYMRLVVARDEEKFYLVDNRNKPKVHVWDGKRRVVGRAENNGHLTWIGVHGKEIIIDFFQGISDGHGMLPFIELLLREYCHLCYGEAEILKEDKFAATEAVVRKECQDSFSFVDADQIPKGRRNSRPYAFQLPGDQITERYECYSYSLKVDAQQFDNYMRRMDSSRSAVMATFMYWAIAELTGVEDLPIVAGVAADVRKIYGAEMTLRDCSDMLPVWYNQEIRSLPWEEQLKRSRMMIVDAMGPERRLAFAADSIKNNQMLNKRVPTLEGKQSLSQRAITASMYYTYGLSLMGKISFGDALDSHIVSLEATMLANAFPIMMVIGQFKNKYLISNSSRFHNDPYLKKFQEEGISCTCKKCEIIRRLWRFFDGTVRGSIYE